MEDSPGNAILVHQTLEHVAEKVADITPLVYARYFSRHPEAHVLFGSDDDDSLKGEMLSKLILQIIDCAEGRSNPDIIASWAADHLGYGVPLAMFPAMFDSIREVLQEAAGEAWTEAVDRAWREQFDGLLASIEAVYQRYSPTDAA